MTHPIPFFPWLRTRAREVERIANIQDQVIELGTVVRFLEADRLKPQPRDPSGRYISTRPDRVAELRALTSSLSDKDRAAAIERAKAGRRG